MDIGVRWIYQQVKDRHGLQLEAGQKPALCFRARKYMLCVAAGHPVRVLKRRAVDFDKARLVTNSDKSEYTIEHAVQMLTGIGARNGITQGARQLLERAQGMVDELLDEDQFNDEEDIMSIKPEKPAEEVATETQVSDTPPADNTDNTTDTQETATVATKAKRAKAKKDKPAKAVKAKAAKGNGTGKKYVPSPDSKLGKAVAFMREEVKKAGGASKLERGFLKELFAKTAKKVGVAESTAAAQYNRQLR